MMGWLYIKEIRVCCLRRMASSFSVACDMKTTLQQAGEGPDIKVIDYEAEMALTTSSSAISHVTMLVWQK